MGNAETKERFEKASKTKLLTAHKLELSNWEKLVERMKKLSQLRSANLADNKLSGPLPHAFLCDSIFSSLKVLDLSGNAITSVDVFSPLCQAPAKKGSTSGADGSCGEFPPFDVIVAGGSSADAVTYPLETLNLSRNKLKHLPPCFLQRFSKLKTLQLSDNEISLSEPWAPAVFMHGVSLVTLDLSNNAISSIPFATPEQCGVPGSLQKLSLLDLSGNALVVLTLPAGCRLGGLQNIKVNHQKKPGGLETIDPMVYALCDKLNDIEFEGSTKPKKAIVDELKHSTEYKEWESKHVAVVNRQLSGNADAKLME